MAPGNEAEWEQVPKDGEQATAEELTCVHDETCGHDEGSGIGHDVEHKAKGGHSWGFNYLKKILKAAKGAATFQVIEFLKKHLEGTKLIFVLGETGTGKSSLPDEITGEKQYLFVDTPGFAAGDINDMEIFQDIMDCLIAIGPFVKIAGVLFLHNIKKDRMTAGELKTIRWLQCFCGPKFYQNITFITTKWDELKPKALIKARGRLEELKTSDFAPLLNPAAGYQGGYLYNHGIPGGGAEDIWGEPLDHEDDKCTRVAEASNLIHGRYGNIDAVELQIKTELDKGKNLLDTEAANALTTLPMESWITVSRGKAVLLRIDQRAQDDKQEDDRVTVCEEKNGVREPSFTENLFQWLDAAVKMALMFSDPTHGIVPAAVNIWQGIKAWWCG